MQCYLSTILSAADCIAEMCPEVGIPYQQRWRRLPQRLGFDMAPAALEASGRLFESDLANFARLAGRYYAKGAPLIRRIGSEGSAAINAVRDAAASHSAVLETMAESLETAADLDGSPELREIMEMQAEGLRRYAGQVRTRLLPPLERLETLMRQCSDLVRQTQENAILDTDTGFVNANGFRDEVENRLRNRLQCCILVIDCCATDSSGRECVDSEFSSIAGEIASRVGEQFRPVDPLGRIAARRLAVIFDGEAGHARGRMEQIARSINGIYTAPAGAICVVVDIQIIEATNPEVLLDLVSQPAKTLPAETAAAH